MEELENCKLVSRISKKSLYVASFSNCGIKVKCNERIKFQAYENSEEEFKKTILVSNSGRVEYVGYNYGQDAKKRNQYCKFYVGKLNKTTGKMKIYSVQLFICKPHLLPPDETLSISEEKTYMEQVDALTGAFGSKYCIKAMQLRHEFALETEALESSVAGAQNSAVEEEFYIPESMKVLTVKKEYTENIPLQNRNATHPEDVYSLNNIITEEEVTSIENDAKMLTEATIHDINMWRSNKQYGSYIMHHCDQFQDMEKAKLLAYYNLMVLMIKLKAKDLNSKDPAPSIPEPFKQNLLDRFTVTSINKRGKMSKFLKTSCSWLTSLKIACCPFINNDCVKAIADFCPFLQELDLRSCRQRQLNQLGFMQISRMTDLTWLDVYRTMIERHSLLTIIRSCLKLEHLFIGSCSSINNYDEVVKEIARNSRHIKSLDLWRAKTLTSVGVIAIAEHCHNLQEIDLGWCLQIDASTSCIRQLVSRCSQLKKLFLTAIRTVSDSDLMSIAEYCEDLIQLDILGTREIGPTSVNRILMSCNKLKFLDVSFCDQIDQHSVCCWREHFPSISIKKSNHHTS